MNRLAFILATCGYVGRCPIVPGTVGTLVTIPFAYALGLVGSPFLTALVLFLIVLLGAWSAGVVEQVQLEHDPVMVVVDESAGFLLTVAFLPPSPLLFLSAFFLFRILDVLKPPPAPWAETLPGGWGIMADDLVVAVYANLMLRAGLYFLGRA